MSLLTTADWFVIAAYFIVLYAVVFRYSRTNRRNPTDFFLAGRNAGWFIVGASIFATNIGSEHLVGLAGSGASGLFPAAQFELIAAFALILLGWLFVPFYLRSGVFTMPEFLEARYSSGVRFYLAAISIVGYVLTKISVTIAAGGIVFEALMGIDFWTGAVIVVLATGVYTVIGGMRAVLVSDMLQMFVMIAGAIVVTIVGLNAVGGWSELRAARAARVLQPLAPDLRPRVSLDRHPVRRADSRHLVLVHRPIHRAADARREVDRRSAARDVVRRVPEATAALHLRRAGRHRLRARAARRPAARATPTARCRR